MVCDWLEIGLKFSGESLASDISVALDTYMLQIDKTLSASLVPNTASDPIHPGRWPFTVERPMEIWITIRATRPVEECFKGMEAGTDVIFRQMLKYIGPTRTEDSAALWFMFRFTPGKEYYARTQ